MSDFNKRDDGTPTAAHVWDEQFKALRDTGQLIGPPPAEKLTERIAELAKAILAFPDHRGVKGWRREVEWRGKQLKRLKEGSDGNAQPAV